jgi:uncharacterized protein YecE (DUF72 family)
VATPARAGGKRAAPRVYIGTSGWAYDSWTDFYAGVPHARWLAHYAEHFDAVEVNATFYHRLKPAAFAHWHEGTPARFRFAIKANRYLTHVKRLAFDAQSWRRQRAQGAQLAEKLAVVLWQLPKSMKRDTARLARFAKRLDAWHSVRHAIEFRDASWFDEEVAGLLAAHRIANAQSDAADWPLWDAVTTDLVYARLHGHTSTYWSRYTARELAAWARRIRRWRDEGRTVHIYFDNTDAGHAVANALELRARLGEVPSRSGRSRAAARRAR